MSKYWTVTVQFETEDNKGRVKKTKETYLVDAMSATEAEAAVYKELEGESNFEVVRAGQSSILRVIEHGE
jgi:hypothetical protein